MCGGTRGAYEKCIRQGVQLSVKHKRPMDRKWNWWFMFNQTPKIKYQFEPRRRQLVGIHLVFDIYLDNKQEQEQWEFHLLNAPGVPIIKPFPCSSFAKFTLLPGEFSVSTSRSGKASPTLTKEGRVVWNSAAGWLARGIALAAKRLVANMMK